MIGQTISHYKVLEKIGGGGMGVVYKAQDLKLDRAVALKFLPPELTLDSEAKGRFVHEARAASSLQHHNICTIHDVDQTADGQMFIVMDLYEGETLKSRIAKGQSRPERNRGMRIEEATDIAIQIAQGLAEAHEHGIIHRDIKPANVIITKNGIAKIVDFGLAKLSGATKVTKTGSTLGTVAYMAPEQLQGSEVDARADIFSLGVVLYEMLTGKTPFRGDHEAALMYSITNEEPEPLQTHIPDVTSELIHVVSRALEKDPASRYKTMDDLLIDLRRVRKETSKVSMPAYGMKRQGFFTVRRIVLMTSAIVLAGVAVTVFILNQPRKLPRLNLDHKERQVLLPVQDVFFCNFSYDGNWIAFAGTDQSSKKDVYYMNSSGGAVRRVTYDSTSYVETTDCSRDGAWILYNRVIGNRREVAAVPSLGGQVHTIAAGAGMGKFWPNSDRILYMTGGFLDRPNRLRRYEIWSAKRDGSDSRLELVDPGCSGQSGGITIDYSLSPDGKALALVTTFPDFSQDIITYDFETKKEFRATSNGTPKGSVFWTRDNFLIYASCANRNYDLWMCPAKGGEQLQLTRSRTDELYGALSDDGSRLLMYEQNYFWNYGLMDLESGRTTSMTTDDQVKWHACVSPDSRYVAYTVGPSYGNWLTLYGIQITDTKGEHPVADIATEERINESTKAWAPDGKWIAYTRTPDSVGGTIKICVVSPFGGSRSKVVADARGAPDQNVYVKWVNRDTLSWFSEMKTWVCSIEDPKPTQLYEDSTHIRLFQGQKYFLFQDYRAGREGWWVGFSPSGAKNEKEVMKELSITGTNVVIAPKGDFLVYLPKRGEIHRVSLPDGKATRLLFSWSRTRRPLEITQDGKFVIYMDVASNSKLMLWENPFIKE